MNIQNYILKNSNTNPSPKTSLNGVVVTPDLQNTKHIENRFPLNFLLTNDVIHKFRKNTFPIIHQSKDGLFMQPVQHIMTPMSDIYVKWMFIGLDYKPSHDHNYPMAKIKDTGYIMRISLDARIDSTFSNNYFTIDYIQDVTKVETVKEFDMMVVRPYQNELDGELITNIITDQNTFFDLYVKDVFRL